MRSLGREDPKGTEDLLLGEEASGEETEKPGDVGDSQ